MLYEYLRAGPTEHRGAVGDSHRGPATEDAGRSSFHPEMQNWATQVSPEAGPRVSRWQGH